ncbi:PREDICTED: 28S ribosomal protein S9, mitochondrial [Theobroma cacao]|uniref:28S ribosomal protein S9, mitochondrial n=1 Tax=Theobroma cacao TaxID=3641 RepID=A0AB32V3F8_THECC|nr:PREDICTED: 28S ribosomal protein S9, mitochondrial [Theobroma cacao]
MLSRLLPKPSHFRLLPLLSSKSQPYPYSPQHPPISLLRFLSTNQNNNNDNKKDQSFSNPWKISPDNDGKFDSLFSDESGNLAGFSSVTESPTAAGEEDGGAGKKSGEGDWLVGEEDKAWSFGEEEKGDGVFDLKGVRDFVETGGETSVAQSDDSVEEQKNFEEEEKQLTAVLKGPNRAFGDLIAASGITDAMLDSLIALKDLEGVDGLPPLSVIEDMRYEKNTRKSMRAEIELLKMEEIAKARVRQVDDKGRAYGTGRRKCSVARVWVQPGVGKFIINDKQFDVYFPMLDHRAALLRPFSETKTLGLWDINCTVKGGGVTGQVGAIQLGISRALQNFEPELRPPLRAAGFLTRDPRVVERKKPGKAKARKSFQWVKR